MADWTKSMDQTFEFYMVDPNSWMDVKRIFNVTKCSISRDLTADTLGSATIDITESIGECYIRVYLIIIQNGITEKHPLGTFLVQTPASSFDGRIRNISMDAYTPLLELKENPPPIGYFIPEGTNIMNEAWDITNDHVRAPVIKPICDTNLYSIFVANTNDNWLTFVSDLIANAKYTFDIDEMGRIMFAPKQELESLQPVWTYTDDNSSILLPDFDMDHDLYGIPNVVEVIYGNNIFKRVENNDPNSPTSIQNRGREIIHRETDPKLNGNSTIHQVEEYATQLLRELSTLEYKISYSHAYCPVRVGDCVRLNYTRAGLTNIKAKVISQTIKCSTGCQVTEKAVFTKKLWG